MMDRVALWKTFKGSSGLLQFRSFPGGTWVDLLTLISYLLPARQQVHNPTGGSRMRIPSFVQAKGWHTAGVSDLCSYVSQIREHCYNLAGVPAHTRPACEDEKRVKEMGGHQELVQHSGQMFCEGHCKFH